jgi:hypothetical protein
VSTPLPHRDARDHAVDKVSGRVEHPPRGARGAQAPALAAERDQVLLATGPAGDAGEAMLEKPAPEVLLELALDVARQAAAVRAVAHELLA